MTATLTQQWLQQQVRLYSQHDRVYADIDSALAHFPTLRPKTDQYTYDDGRTQLLLCVHGLLPISFKQASYNIPIAVWIAREYPRLPPIPYVVPTNDMLVKAGKYMQVSGRCTAEYVQNWERKSEGCHLAGLLEAMQELFSREPPVYAKPKETSTPSPNPTPDEHSRPRLPPKPFESGARSPISRPESIPQRPLSGVQSTFLEQRPSRLEQRQPPPLPPSLEQRHVPISPPNLPISPPNLPDTRPPHYAATHTISPVYRPNSQIITPRPSSFTPLNLLDDEDNPPPVLAVQSIAPPRPPNPELLRIHMLLHQKISSELSTLSAALAADAERLRAQQADLFAGEPAIRDEMARLEAVRDVSRSVASRLKQTVDEAESNVSTLRRKGDPEVDELVCSTSIVHNQLINLVAEDNAIEDTMYHLHRALNTGRIDLERFLRTTRVLAESQFMKRALTEKIHVGLGMV